MFKARGFSQPECGPYIWWCREWSTGYKIAYSGFITEIAKKHKDLMQTLFETVYDSVYNNDDESDGQREPDEEDTYEYALLQDYYEGNLLTRHRWNNC